jgi:Iap family predicted aminopeptidase
MGVTMKRVTVLFLFTCALLLLLPVAGAQAATPTYGEAVDQLVADGYPQGIEDFLCGLGTSTLGFRLAGTSAEHQAAQYLKAQMEAIGLQNVRLEAVPVDAWGIKEASLTVGEKVITGSQFAGVPPTGPAGLTGDVVYVGDGTAQEFDAAGDVSGKLVVIDTNFEGWWLDFPAGEATLRGAKGVIMTYGPNSAPWYEPMDSLGSNDGEYKLSWVPIIYIARQDGDWLKGELKKGPVTAKMVTEADVQLAKDGGTGYNVVGELPGSSDSPQKVLVASHHDAHFRAGLDDTGAVAAQMTMAKAMVLSGAEPQHTVVFMVTTGEEFGYTDCWFDWSIGAWYAITHTHPEWAGQVRGFLNLEAMARAGGKLTMRTSAEMAPWLTRAARGSSGWLPNGYSVSFPAHTWNDEWTFTAAGVPSVTFGATGDDYDPIYHTNLETKDLVDWAYVGTITKFVGKLQRGLDGGLLPYNLKKRADDLAQSIVPGQLVSAGADQATVLKFATWAQKYRNATNRYQARRGMIPAAHIAAVNAGIVKIEKKFLKNFTALDAWDYTSYPHQQVLYDTQQLNTAIGAITQRVPRPSTALNAIANVGTMWYGLSLSNDVYKDYLAMRAPGYALLTWGAQGHRAPEPDLTAEYRLIEAGKYADAAASLKPLRDSEVDELNARLVKMTHTLEHLVPMVNALK